MSPVGAIFVPFPPKTGKKLLYPRPPQSLNGSRSGSGKEVGVGVGDGGARGDAILSVNVWYNESMRNRRSSVLPRHGPAKVLRYGIFLKRCIYGHTYYTFSAGSFLFASGRKVHVFRSPQPKRHRVVVSRASKISRKKSRIS